MAKKRYSIFPKCPESVPHCRMQFSVILHGRRYSQVILSPTTWMVQVTILNSNNLQTIIWFQVFQLNTNNLNTVISVELANLVEDDPKASFSIATTPRCVGEGATAFPGLFHFTLDPYLLLLSLSKAASSTIFWVFGMIRPEIEPRSPGPLANTLLIKPMAR